MIQVLEVLIRSSLVLVIGLSMMRMLRRQSAALRHWTLFASLVCAAVVPLVSLVLPKWEAVPLPSPAVMEAPAPKLVTPAPTAVPASGAGLRTDDQFPVNADTLVAVGWALGVVISLGLLAAGVWRLHRLDRDARPVTSGPWRNAAPNHTTIRVTQRALLVVWGLRRHSIIVPAAALAWPEARVRAVVRHEIAHIRRNDWMLLIVSEAIRALYWFHPLVWVVCARLRTECEMACDDRAIVEGAAGPEYASHVIDIARELKARHWLPAPAIVRASTLERRVRAMLDKSRNRAQISTRARRMAAVAMAAATVAVTALAAQSFVSLSGTIVDPSNAVLPNVTLQLTNEDTQAKYEIKTDRNGRYEFVGLPSGTYRLESRLPGFSTFTGRVVISGKNLQQDVELGIGMLEETITVTSGPPGTPEPPVRAGLSEEERHKLEDLRRKRAQQAAGGAGNCPPDPPPGSARIGGNIRVPLKFKDKRPVYPEALKGTAGKVILQATLGQDGSINGINVVESTHPEFTDSAIAAVREWEFDATLLNCQRIETPIKITVNYAVRQ